MPHKMLSFCYAEVVYKKRVIPKFLVFGYSSVVLVFCFVVWFSFQYPLSAF